MMVVSNFIYALARVLDIAIEILIWLIVIRALLSWFRVSPYNRLVYFLYWATEPFLHPIRRLLARYFPPTGVDFSPMITILLLIFLKYFLVRSLYQLAFRL